MNKGRRAVKTIELELLEDRVLVAVADADEVTPGGIVIPDKARNAPQRGTVVGVGPGRQKDDGEHVEMKLSVGDVVYFTRYAGVDIELDGDELKVMRESDIVGIVR